MIISVQITDWGSEQLTVVYQLKTRHRKDNTEKVFKKLCEFSDKETWPAKHQYLDAQTAELDSLS